MAYSAGHSGSFNPAVITNQEAHMIYGNMDSQKGHKKESSSAKITSFFKKDTSNKSSINTENDKTAAIQPIQLPRPDQCTPSIELSIVSSQSTPTCQNVALTTTTHSPAASVTLQDNATISIVTPFQPVHYDFPKTKTALTYEYVIPKCGDALAMVHEKAKTVMDRNRRCFMKILQSIRYLGRQGIAFQGDTDEASNFLQLMKLRAMDDPTLGEWITRGQDTYLSHDIQNEIL
eukprot:Seg13317.1 transcript_id=Seg13317.1/GoldUCD/mRNA.D3Y31 product="hypothetical protein" protein_id=Seg13317.1/GoldUCD/D3Y31